MLALVCALTANAQLLYSISGKDLKKPSYVFGTFHIANTPFVEKVAGIRSALDNTDQVYGELKWDDMTNPDSLRAMQAHMMLPEGKTLKTVLPYAVQEAQRAAQAVYGRRPGQSASGCTDGTSVACRTCFAVAGVAVYGCTHGRIRPHQHHRPVLPASG